jgi:anti-anti-sigma factor
MLKVHAKKSGATEVLSLEGKIVVGNTEALRRTVQSASDASDIILDLANVTIVDAHGLGVLLQLRAQSLAKGVHFELRNLRKSLYRVFEITRLNTVFKIDSGVEFYPEFAYQTRLPVAA